MVKDNGSGCAHQQCVAIWLGLCNIRCANDGGHAGFVFHHHRLAKTGWQFFSQNSCHLVDTATRGVTHHDGDGLDGVVLSMATERGESVKTKAKQAYQTT